MSRIRGIEVKVQKEVLQTRKYGLNEILKKKNEEQSSNSKDDVEKQQIHELLYKLPKLDKIFEVHRKIGEGTFSSVYLGSLRQHVSLPDTEKRWFAIKHLVPTAHPARIEHELRCLQDMGGKDHVIGVELCLRHLDTIVFVMPYIPHRKFSEYVGEMDAAELREYMRALLVALRHVHSFGVIHRDVKPSNFLYDRENRRYLLVDFGLAQRLCAPSSADNPRALPPPAHNNNRKRMRDEDDLSSEAKRVALDLTVGIKEEAMEKTAPTRGGVPAKIDMSRILNARSPMGRGRCLCGGGAGSVRCGCACSCACAGKAGVCNACTSRTPARAPRAGTQGFRPPEVLLKHPHQTTAVDVWASGVVLASALSARYPFFRAADDVSALAELADFLGTEPLRRAATALGRRLLADPVRRGLCLRKLCARLRTGSAVNGVKGAGGRCPRCCPALCVCREEAPEEQTNASPGEEVAGFPDSAFNLATRLLEPDPALRLSAAEALAHPFLKER